jgi:hypothetical protein
MQRFSGLIRAFAAIAVLGAVAGCQDEIPTATSGLLPTDARPTTVEWVVPASEFAAEVGQFGGFNNALDAPYLLVANRFDGVLEAHTLARLTDFPATVTFTLNGAAQTDSAFVYGAGRVVARVDTAASTSAGPVTLQLWSLAQPWDPASVSWTYAVDTAGVRVPWTQPGGTRGRLLAEVTRTPGDTLMRDSLVWTVDSLTVAEMATSEFRGLLVTATGSPARLQIANLALRTTTRPVARQDTAIAQSIVSGREEFVFTPEPPTAPGGVWQVGGVGSGRTLFRLTLPRTLPTCPPGTGSTGGNCRQVALRDVTVNQATLLLDPVPVGGGFRPLAPVNLMLHVVGEPELGRQAPLGSVVATALVPARRFATPADSAVALSLTRYLQGASAGDTVPGALALLSDPNTRNFGLARFAAAPRLRLVYTLSRTPTNP